MVVLREERQFALDERAVAVVPLPDDDVANARDDLGQVGDGEDQALREAFLALATTR